MIQRPSGLSGSTKRKEDTVDTQDRFRRTEWDKESKRKKKVRRGRVLIDNKGFVCVSRKNEIRKTFPTQ